MKPIATLVLVAAALAVSSPAMASQKLAGERGCLECHSTDKEVWGPSFKLIAKYYRSLPDAQDRIAKRIMTGGAEHWGADRYMPAQATKPYPMSDADAKALAGWILKQK